MSRRIVLLEGYGAMPRRRRRVRRHVRHHARRGRGGKIGAAARACVHKGHKPGTHAFGSCVRSHMKRR